MQTLFQNASQNQVKQWARLADAKFRREDSMFLAEGAKVVEELLKSDWEARALLVLLGKDRYWEKRIDLDANRIPVYQLTRPQFNKLSQDKEPEGIAAVVQKKDPPTLTSFLPSATGPLLIGHEIANPQNLGALARSAHWFGFAGILLGARSVDWTNPKVIRASMGSIFHLNVFEDMDLASVLPDVKKHYLLIGSDVRQGVSPRTPGGKTALLLGSESHGLPESLLGMADERWRIPGGSQTESLSLPQAAAIMMHEMTKKAVGC
jgi:TrmH family RNA methyltransferase